ATAERSHAGIGGLLRGGDRRARGVARSARRHDPGGGAARRWRLAGAGRMTSRAIERLGYYLPAVAVFVGGIVLWELVVRAFSIERFLLPAPTAIAGSFADDASELLHAGLTTLIEAVGGFAIGLTTGLVVAFVTARFAFARGALMPFAI